MSRGKWAISGLLLGVLLITTGCGDAGTPHGVGGPSGFPSTGRSPTPTLDVNAQAIASATAVVRRYYSTVDELGQRPATTLSRLESVATSVQLAAEQRVLVSQRKAGERQVGDTVIARLEVESVNLNNVDPSVGKVPTVQVDVCWNVSGADVVNASGTSVISPQRRDVGWTQLTVANYQYEVDPIGGWRVASGQDLKRTPCEPS